MAFDCSGSFYHRLESAVRGPEIPTFQERFGFFLRLVIEVLKGELDLICLCGLQIQRFNV